jgi:DNA-binding Xre family transcriptional regulator
MVNINKLKGKIIEKGLTVEKLAEKIGIDRSTIYRKMSASGKSFTIKEANLICQALELSGQEAMTIFFADYVA